MHAVGLITEYNPLHNGHIYHLEKAKKITDADCTIAVMSGNFVQRGEPAIFDKYHRTKAAVDSGIDLLIELPAFYALSSAEGFAFGAVKTLENLNVSSIVFGSECGNIDQLSYIADILSNETDEYRQFLSKYITAGNSFPAARQLAVEKILAQTNTDFTDNKNICSILSNPNNILGIEYLKALKKCNSDIAAHTIIREGTGYNETTITGLPSASAIRNNILSGQSALDFQKYIPSAMMDVINDIYSNNIKAIQIDDFSFIFNTTLLKIINNESSSKKNIITKISSYQDISEDLAARIYNLFTGCEQISSFCNRLKSKQYTYSRISRAIMHIILDMTKEKSSYYVSDNIPYIRILGFNETGAKYLSYIRKKCNVPLITKVSDYAQLLSDDIYCSHIYNEVLYNKCGYVNKDEYRAGIYKS